MSTYRVLKSIVVDTKDTVNEYGWRELSSEWKPGGSPGYVTADSLGIEWGEGHYLVVPNDYGQAEEHHVIAVPSYEFAADNEASEVAA